MAAADSIAALKQLARSARKIALEDFDAACDEIGALLNHKQELLAEVERLKSEVAKVAGEVKALATEHEAKKAAMAVAVKLKDAAEAAAKDAQLKLVEIKAKISAFLA